MSGAKALTAKKPSILHQNSGKIVGINHMSVSGQQVSLLTDNPAIKKHRRSQPILEIGKNKIGAINTRNTGAQQSFLVKSTSKPKNIHFKSNEDLNGPLIDPIIVAVSSPRVPNSKQIAEKQNLLKKKYSKPLNKSFNATLDKASIQIKDRI